MNEMSNKMKKYLIVGLVLVWELVLFGFTPSQNDFTNSYQYELYKSWLKKGNFKTNFPSSFFKEKIVKQYKNRKNEVIVVEYDWENYKIFNQKEKINFAIEDDTTREIIESLIYRLNCDDEMFFQNFLENSGIAIEFENLTHKEAVDSLWNYFGNSRIELVNLQTKKMTKNLEVIFTEKNGKQFTCVFPPDYKISLIKEENISREKIDKTRTVKPAGSTKHKIKPRAISHGDLILEDYIALNYGKMQTKELLQNKISDIKKFVKKEFPYHQVINSGEDYAVSKQLFQDKYSSNLLLKIQKNRDGIEIYPDIDFSVKNKILRTSCGDSINLANLNSREIELISPFLIQLIFEHRAIGTKLLNFLLIHDRVSTSLVVRGEKRQFYEIYSYANLLLLLNKYWQDRIVYFNLRDIKKVNGYIEFRGYLFAVEPATEIYDFAEIRFRLDKDYKMDLIMMFLYPQEQLKG